MKRALVAVALLVTAVQLSGANAASTGTIKLKVGDAVAVAGTKIACYAIHSNGKDGIGCLLLKGAKPMTASYGVGIAGEGTVTLNRIKADGSGTKIFKRRSPQAGGTVYKAHIGDLFGWQISEKIALACRVLNITSGSVQAAGRGVRVSCWRATATEPVPRSYGVTISDKIAGVFRFDAKGNVTSWGLVRRQP